MQLTPKLIGSVLDHVSLFIVISLPHDVCAYEHNKHSKHSLASSVTWEGFSNKPDSCLISKPAPTQEEAEQRYFLQFSHDDHVCFTTIWQQRHFHNVSCFVRNKLTTQPTASQMSFLLRYPCFNRMCRKSSVFPSSNIRARQHINTTGSIWNLDNVLLDYHKATSILNQDIKRQKS